MKKYKIILFVLLCLGVLAAAFIFLRDANIAVFNPQGTIAHKQRNLMYFALLLSVIIVVPVFALTFGIAWKYRASNKKARYTPNWDRSRLAETIWWLVPLALILILSVVTWFSSHDLDPYKSLVSTTKSLKVQVVALQWKWLFVYPEQGIATVNYLQFPEKTPVDFQITSDAPMNSFWIPQLGGQVYAMTGMSTQLHLIADHAGEYRGVSANISGKGFAGMNFTARSTTQADFDQWAQSVKKTVQPLSMPIYNKLAEPSENMSPILYSSVENGLYDTIVMKYMTPTKPSETPVQEDMPGMHMEGMNHGAHH